jgi:antitoxin component YwqK of YwqJK toxin-antitoxin module
MKYIKLYESREPEVERTYFESGALQSERWYNEDEELHREEGPAEVRYFPNGNVSRENWIKNNISHHEDGPASIWYYDNGKVHTKMWAVNNMFSRDDGPAKIWYEQDGRISHEQWYLDDINITNMVIGLKGEGLSDEESISLIKLGVV